MKLTLKKELENGTIKKLLTTSLEDMDEFIITNFQDELDMELYFSDPFIGRFYLTSYEKEKETDHKIFYRSDYENFRNKLDFGAYDNKEFIKCLSKNCPNLSDKLNNEDIYQNVATMIDVLDEKTVIKNFRNIYSAVEEYSIKRVEDEKNKVLNK